MYIAHRLRTIADADKIIVLEDGAVKEEGTHMELLSTDILGAKISGIFRRTWK